MFSVHIEILLWYGMFRVAEMLRNITKHSLVPRHQLLVGERLAEIMKKHGIEDTQYLPRLLTSDPVVRFHGWKRGDVIAIDRQELGDSGLVQACLALRQVN